MDKKHARDLEVGDRVIICHPHTEETIGLVTSTKQKTLIAVESKNQEYKFKKSNGFLFGSSNSWYQTTVKYATEEDIERINEQEYRLNLLHLIKSVDYNKLPTNELELFKDLIKKTVEKTKYYKVINSKEKNI